MQRHAWTMHALQTLGYHKRTCLSKCSCDELPCPLITWLVLELKSSCQDIEGERITGAILAGDLRAFLKELACPHTALTADTLTPVTLSHITEFLVSELQAARMMLYRQSHPEDKHECCESAKECRGDKPGEDEIVRKIEELQLQDDRIEKDAEETRKELRLLLEALQMNAYASLTDLQQQVKSSLAQLPGEGVPKPLLKNEVGSNQWKQLDEINHALADDYRCRKHMLMKRFEVTLQSFTWGEKGKEREKVISSMSAPPLSVQDSCISISSLLAAREDQSRILPVRAGPSTAVHKVLMGSVPDRGGRPGEIEPPMPDWKRERAHGDNSHRRQRPRKKEEARNFKKKNRK